MKFVAYFSDEFYVCESDQELQCAIKVVFKRGDTSQTIVAWGADSFRETLENLKLTQNIGEDFDCYLADVEKLADSFEFGALRIV